MQAARAELAPLGLIQVGKSRSWLDDHGWWVIGVDFNSPAYAQGSGLVVYADFLWEERDYLAYSVGGRVGVEGHLLDQSFVELAYGYESHEQFRLAAMELAQRAAKEVADWRAAFPTLNDWREVLLDISRDKGFLTCFDAAVAAGLTGHYGEADELFGRVVDMTEGSEYARDMACHDDAGRLRNVVSRDPERFVRELSKRAQVRRAQLKLPRADLLEGGDGS